MYPFLGHGTYADFKKLNCRITHSFGVSPKHQIWIELLFGFSAYLLGTCWNYQSLNWLDLWYCTCTCIYDMIYTVGSMCFFNVASFGWSNSNSLPLLKCFLFVCLFFYPLGHCTKNSLVFFFQDEDEDEELVVNNGRGPEARFITKIWGQGHRTFTKCETSYNYKAASKNRATTVKTTAGGQEKGFEEYLACDPLAGYPICEMFELHTVDGDDVWYVVKNQIVMTFSEFRPVFLSWTYSPLSPFVHSGSTGQIDYATVYSILAKWHLWPLHWTFGERRGNSHIIYCIYIIYYII